VKNRIEYIAGVKLPSESAVSLCVKPRATPRAAALVLLPLLLLLAACSPALDWRNVEIAGLRTVLPCKPDRAERGLTVGEWPVTVSMAGCEAKGSLFAISRMAVPAGVDAAALEAAWRSAALIQMRASHSEALAAAPTRPQSPDLRIYRAIGQRPDGSPVQASLVWAQDRGVVFHLAVYASALDATLTEPLLRDLQWR
jgi:hypothetical protein